MKRGLISNKRGQDVGFGRFLGIVLGVIGVALVIMFLFNLWGFADIFATLDTEVTSRTCNTFVSLGSSDSYCNTELEANKRMFYNCPYAVRTGQITITEENQDKLKTILGKDEYDRTNGGTISSEVTLCEPNGAKAICEKFKLKQGEDFNSKKIKVNDATCFSWGVKAESDLSEEEKKKLKEEREKQEALQKELAVKVRVTQLCENLNVGGSSEQDKASKCAAAFNNAGCVYKSEVDDSHCRIGLPWTYDPNWIYP